ncbi:MAG: glycosyltransferase family 39 protein [Chloroflexaceae bacterium]|nr:glycosyltransferase family 39 protein [Chloroflexaceae bacterium]
MKQLLEQPTNQTVSTIVTVVILACLGLFVTYVMDVGHSYNDLPFRDSGVFLYAGQQVLEGKIPYRDVWDHKPPAVFYVNALGLLIGKGHIDGIYILEKLSVYAASVCGFFLMSRAFDAISAVFATILWLITLPLILDGGNLVTEYALPWQFLILYLFWSIEKHKTYSWKCVALGIAVSMCFLFKPNTIGIGIAVVVYWLGAHVLVRRTLSSLRPIVLVGVGSVLLGLAIAAYFRVNHAFGALFDAVLRYNIVYSATDSQSKFFSLSDGIATLPSTGIYALALTAWITGLFMVIHNDDQDKTIRPLLAVSLVGLPVELVLSSISGRSYNHYYMAWLPMMTILVAFFAYTLRQHIPTRLDVFGCWRIRLTTVILIGLLVAFWTQQSATMRFKQKANQERYIHVTEYIQKNTHEQEYVLMWGAEAVVNFMSRRPSPTRFVYQYPLYTVSYQSATLVQEFMHDIETNKPVLIIDTSATNGVIPPLNPDQRSGWSPLNDPYGLSYGVLPEMESVFAYIHSHYTLVDTIHAWNVYRRVD